MWWCMVHPQRLLEIIYKIVLHIITPLFRPEFLDKVYNSIYIDNDITWHISKSSHTDKLKNDFINNDKRVIVYEVDCLDTDTTTKRNTVLEKIIDGYFCFLDDDTIFHENMYLKYRECIEHRFMGMLIGEQIDDKGLRLIASHPIYSKIDTGNVLSYHDCLKECKWPSTHIKGVNQKDYIFWNSVYEYYGKKCAIWNQPISYYNKLNPTKK